MMEHLTVVKVGGAIIEDATSLGAFVQAFASLKGRKVLVHGGGKIATKLADSQGVAVAMIDGRRVTDDQMIELVIMAYSGLNKKISALIAAEGMAPIGVSGADGNFIRSQKRPEKDGIDFGWVGDVMYVKAEFLEGLIARDLVPVVAPLTHDGKGRLLNTNADTIASEVAIALSDRYHVSLNYVFDQKGVMADLGDPNSVIKSITRSDYERLKVEGVVSGGMIPKLDNAFSTISRGVSEVRLLNTAALRQLENPDFDEYTSIH